MNDSEIIWMSMAGISWLVAILVLFDKVDAESIQKASRIWPMSSLFR